MLFPILFSCFGINDLGVVELWSCRKDGACDLWGELTDGESPTRTGYKFGCHMCGLKCKYIIKFNKGGNFQQKTEK